MDLTLESRTVKDWLSLVQVDKARTAHTPTRDHTWTKTIKTELVSRLSILSTSFNMSYLSANPDPVRKFQLGTMVNVNNHTSSPSSSSSSSSPVHPHARYPERPLPPSPSLIPETPSPLRPESSRHQPTGRGPRLSTATTDGTSIFGSGSQPIALKFFFFFSARCSHVLSRSGPPVTRS